MTGPKTCGVRSDAAEQLPSLMVAVPVHAWSVLGRDQRVETHR